ncbi:SAM-dependent methyltransferase [Terriglobus sp.]|uniref:SAM-dependent methyltransferase n=1 Tax=Terriglobus sp. TaxID=1889013 RepID=UPI003AFFDD54
MTTAPTDIATIQNAPTADLFEPAPLPATQPIDLEQYYSEAGPDYAAWSSEFNMHFGFYRRGMNPLDRESMLEQMNREVLAALQVDHLAAPRVLDLGCGLGATLRSFARQLPYARLLGITRVPWQVEQANQRSAAAGLSSRVHVVQGEYQDTILPRGSYDAVYALESSCHAHGDDKRALLTEAYRLLRPGGRLVVADGFLMRPLKAGLQQRIYRKLCQCWIIEDLARLDRFHAQLEKLGFTNVAVTNLQWRVAPSVAHVPWVTLKFLLSDVLFSRKRMTRARWNNVLAPLLMPWISAPLGPMCYQMITATKPAQRR